jgi:predicted transcriptional regulator
VLIAKRLESTQVRAKREELKAEKRIKKLINPAILLTLKQQTLLWVKTPTKRLQELTLAPKLTIALKEVDDNIKELLLDALISKACVGTYTAFTPSIAFTSIPV